MDLSLEHGSETRELGSCAGDQHAGDRQTAGQRCEVLDRVPNLSDQFVHAGLGGTFCGHHLGNGLTDASLHPFRVRDRQVQRCGHSRGGGIAAGPDGADELWTTLLMDDDNGEASTDRYDRLRLL